MTHKHDKNHENDDVELVEDDEVKPHKGFGKSDDTLREELKKANAEKQEYLEGWQRAKADLINFKRDAEKASSDSFARGVEAVITDLLPALDAFDMAFGNKEAWEAAPANWRAGVEYIHQQLLKTLTDHGVEQFDPIGQEFDPREHEPLKTVAVENPDDEHKIVAVIQKGYRHRGAVLRPARVHVGHFEQRDA